MDLLDLLALVDSPASDAATGDPIPESTRCTTCGQTAYGPCGALNATTVRLPDGRWRTTSSSRCGRLRYLDTYGRKTLP